MEEIYLLETKDFLEMAEGQIYLRIEQTQPKEDYVRLDYALFNLKEDVKLVKLQSIDIPIEEKLETVRVVPHKDELSFIGKAKEDTDMVFLSDWFAEAVKEKLKSRHSDIDYVLIS